MARINCFLKLLPCGKKKPKKSPQKGNCDLSLETNIGGVSQVKPEGVFPLVAPTKEQTVHDNVAGNDVWSAKVEAADYEGGDEQDEEMSMKRDFSDFDLQALVGKEENNFHDSFGFSHGISNSDRGEEEVTPELVMKSGHVSDPGIGRTTALWGSPHLKRSCSNIETKGRIQIWGSPTKTRSYNDLENLAGNANRGLLNGMPTSPLSVITNCSADRVMLKKRSSSQVLPSRSRKLWWKLFLWSHRNLHNPRSSKQHSSARGITTQEGGYCSDTLEPQSKGSTGKKLGFEKSMDANRTDLRPQNEWIVFSMGLSPQERVNAWVNSLDAVSSSPVDDDDVEDEEPFFGTNFLNCEIGESSGKELSRAAGKRIMEEVSQTNNIIQSLNTTSTVAHMPGIGLKAVPAISAFTCLRAINLSGNLIVQITTGSLPKSLQTLDLSRNKIAVIEGLRELTRLRVLNLSYNRISRIGQGLSSCTVIKELYLAGNKISDVEGLHRLLKLTVLDLSFNKITTAKALGQLVANYNSLLALNLLGNPIQHNIGDDHLRKVVSGLLRSLAYLNKQPIKLQRGRDAAPDRVAKAALGDSLWNSKKKLTRRLSQSSGTSVKGGKGVDGFRGVGSSVGGGGHRTRKHSLKAKHHQTSRK